MGIEAEQAILAAATPRPWERLTSGYRDTEDQLAAIRGMLEAAEFPNTDMTHIVTPDLEWEVALVGNGPKQTDNGDLIVRAVNSYEAFLGLVEAADKALQAYVGTDTEWSQAAETEAISRLRAALDAVTATLGGEE